MRIVNPRRGVLLALSVLAAGCGGSGAGDAPKRRGGGPIPVTTTVLASGDLVYAVAGTGSLEAYQVVTVASRIDGVVEAVAFDEGDEVTPEKELTVVDRTRRLLEKAEAETAVAKAEAAVPRAQAALPRADAAIAQAAASVERANAQISAARTDLKEAEDMLARRMALRASTSGAVAEEEVTAARSQVERRRDAIAVAEAGAREAAASQREAEAGRIASAAEEAEAVAGVAQARAKLRPRHEDRRRHRRALPHPGHVRRRHVTLGQYVRAGDAIAEIVDRSRLLVRFRVSEAESARLARDMKVAVRVPALDAADHPAILVHVDETASPTTRMVECLAELDKPTATLKPGFYAVANVQTRTARALAVPESALQPTERGWIGYVVVDGKAKARLLDARPPHERRPRRDPRRPRRRRDPRHEGREHPHGRRAGRAGRGCGGWGRRGREGSPRAPLAPVLPPRVRSARPFPLLPPLLPPPAGPSAPVPGSPASEALRRRHPEARLRLDADGRRSSSSAAIGFTAPGRQPDARRGLPAGQRRRSR